MYKNKYISELPINEVKEYFDKLRCNTPWTAEQFADFEMCKERLTVYACKTLEQIEWIPVSERLPEDFQRVLVTVVNCNGNKVVRVAEYSNYKGVFRIKENHEEWEIGEKGLLAWRPLPEPYKTESEAAE